MSVDDEKFAMDCQVWWQSTIHKILSAETISEVELDLLEDVLQIRRMIIGHICNRH